MKRYEEYKESGVEWIGEVPSHWNSVRLKYLGDFVGGGTPSKAVVAYWSGNIPWVSPKDMKRDLIAGSQDYISKEAVENSTVRLVDVGAVLFVVRSGILRHSIPVAINTVPITLNQDMKALRLKSQCDPRFVMYYVRGNQRNLLYEWRKQGATVESIEQENLDNAYIPLPPLPEQRAIAAFLDRKTEQIDTLIRKKQRLIELLKEQRTALINRAVTKGLDPNVPMKDSGIEWLGEVPEHWEVSQLRYLVPDDRGIMYGIVLPGPHVDGGIPIVKANNCLPGRLRIDLMKRTDPDIEKRYVRSRLRPGDLVISIRGSYGAVSIIPPELDGANLTQDAARIAPREDVSGSWLRFTLMSSYVQAFLDSRLAGATVKGINIMDLQRVPLAVPPHDEQENIATQLGRVVSRYDDLVRRERMLIDRLKALRTSLISEVVTGKIDVRDWERKEDEVLGELNAFA